VPAGDATTSAGAATASEAALRARLAALKGVDPDAPPPSEASSTARSHATCTQDTLPACLLRPVFGLAFGAGLGWGCLSVVCFCWALSRSCVGPSAFFAAAAWGRLSGRAVRAAGCLVRTGATPRRPRSALQAAHGPTADGRRGG
jgi:hypothetical protein